MGPLTIHDRVGNLESRDIDRPAEVFADVVDIDIARLHIICQLAASRCQCANIAADRRDQDRLSLRGHGAIEASHLCGHEIGDAATLLDFKALHPVRGHLI